MASAPIDHSAEQTANDIGLYFGLVLSFFALIPIFMMMWRLLTRPTEGLSACFSPPYDLDPSKRRLSARMRNFLYQRTSYGFLLDVVQALVSAVSCLLFIVISYAQTEPLWVTDVEDAFTVYFAIDYGIRLWLVQDTLAWYFSLTSLLDFITVVPALTAWLIQAGGEYDASVAVVVQSIRVFRVFRMFRVIRVIRLLSLSPSYAFQRQLFVLAMTILSLIFVAAGMYQIFEAPAWQALNPGKDWPFHKSVYYAAITVVGRPGVPVDGVSTAVFLTITVMVAVTTIPTFVAELIRLWFDNTALDTLKGNPETPHVLVCGDTNVSRLRALAQQYFHRSRDPDTQTPLVILAEAKPEGALRNFIDQYRFSGLVRYIRGSARRAADLRRADIGRAQACIVLNYRADRDAAAADTEVLSTVMAIKNTSPHMRVLAQLWRPRKRNHLKAVPGWQDGDKSVSAVSLGMTLMGLAARVPGFATFVTNLVRRGAALAGLPDRSLAGRALPWWYLMLYGDVAKHAALATLPALTGAPTTAGGVAGGRQRTPLEEYALSIDAAVHELEVTPGLEGRTFAATARLAYLRYGVTLLGATLPVNDDVFSLVPGLPKTYRLVLFPAQAVLRRGMRLYAVAASAEAAERLRAETGGTVRTVFGRTMEVVGSAFVFGNSAHTAANAMSLSAGGAAGGAGPGGAVRLGGDADPEAATPSSPGGGDAGGGGGAASGVAPTHSVEGAGGWLANAGVTSASAQDADSYPHNAAAATDLALPWCFCELDDIAAAQTALLHKLHLDALGGQHHGGHHAGVAAVAHAGAASAVPSFDRHGRPIAAGAAAGEGSKGSPCPSCHRAPTRTQPLSLLRGQGICVLATSAGEEAAEEAAAAAAATAVATPAAPAAAAPMPPPHSHVAAASADFDFARMNSAAAPIPAAAEPPAASSDSPFAFSNSNPYVAPAHAAADTPPPAASASSPAATPVTLALSGGPPLVVPRRTSIGDDGLGGIDDTDDIQGPRGPLLTMAPHFNASVGIAATARLAARANVNALAVRLALPVTAVTDVESMAADALETDAGGGGGGGVGGGGIATVRVGGKRLAGHVLVCGASDNMGYLLRALASLSGPRSHGGVSTLDYGVEDSGSGSSPGGGGGGGPGGFSPFRGTKPPTAPSVVSAAAAAAPSGPLEEGDQYAVRAQDVVVLAPAKPAEGAMNAMYPGSARLLGHVTFVAGNPAEAADLLRAGILTARAAVVLTTSKPTATADGSDNLTDDSDAIVTSAIIAKLNPGLHVVTELLHGGHAAYIRPQGNGLNDASRGALIGILEEREASRQRGRLEEAIKRVAAEREIRTAGPGPGGATTAAASSSSSRTDILLSKLYRQHMRLKAAMTGTLVFSRPSPGPALFGPGSSLGGSGGGGGPSSNAAAYSLAITPKVHVAGAAAGGRVTLQRPTGPTSGGGGGLGAAVDALDAAHGTAGSSSSGGDRAAITDAELERVAESGLSHAAIVDVLVGVREEFGASSALEGSVGGAGGGGGGGGSGGGGASKGSGATNDLFAAPAFAAGRVFSFNTMDAIVCEQHFEAYIVGVLKQLVRAARRQRFVAIPLTEAVVMARIASTGSPYAAAAGPAASGGLVAECRAHYLSELAIGIIGAARGGGGEAAAGADAPHHSGGDAAVPAATPHHWADAPVRTYGVLFEALLRGWGLLPLGLYRRVHPATGLRVNPQTGAALQLAAGPPAARGGFVHNRALVSYVYTCPPPDAILSEHDMVYVLLPEAGAGADGLHNHHV